MKTVLKHFVINTVSLYAISLVVSGIVFSNGMYSIILAGVALTLTTLIIKPVINILLLPINLITFGLFRWLGFTISLYLVTLVVPGFKLLDFSFKGFSSSWFTIPPILITGILAFIAFSFPISFVASVGYWILK